MIARFLVLLLLFANAVWWGWSQGWLAPLGFAPARVSEPERIAQQQNPEALRIVRAAPGEGASAPAEPADTAPRCWRVGPIDASQTDALRAALAQLEAKTAWRLDAETLPGRWMVYMGRYADTETLARKQAELRKRNVPFEVLREPALAPGLSLGVHTTEAEAQAALERLSERGVRSARVLTLQPPLTRYWLTLNTADDTQRERLQRLPSLAQRTWQNCPEATAPAGGSSAAPAPEVVASVAASSTPPAASSALPASAAR